MGVEKKAVYCSKICNGIFKEKKKKGFPEYHSVGSGQPSDSVKNEHFWGRRFVFVSVSGKKCLLLLMWNTCNGE